MPTVTFTNAPTAIDLAQATTNWGGDTFSVDNEIFIQGGASVSCAQTNNGNNDAYVTGTWDFSGTGLGDQHLRLPFNCTYVTNWATTNAVQVFLFDGTNTAYYAWDGAADYSGGWARIHLWTGLTPTSGTVNKANITRIGIRVVTATKPRNQPANMWFDAWYYGDGYTITGGTNGDEIFWDDIAAADAVQGYGICTYDAVQQVPFLAGDIKVGNGATTTFFKDTGQTPKFIDVQVDTSLYGITFQGSGLTADLSSGSYSAAGLQRYFFDCSDTAPTLDIVGKQFSRTGLVSFAAGQSITGCTFDDCLQIDPSTATFQTNTISNYQGAEGGAVLYPNTDTNFSNNTFNSAGTGYALELSENGTATRTFDTLFFNGYGANNTTNAVVNYTGTSAFDLAYSGGDEPTVNPTSLVTVIQNQVTVTFNGLVAGGEFRIYDNDADANPITLGTNREGVESLTGTSYVLTHPTSEDGNIIFAQYINPLLYEEQVVQVTLSTNNQNINFVLIPETNI